MAFSLDELRAQLVTHTSRISEAMFEEFKREVSKGNIIFDIHNHGINSDEDIKKYITNLLTCCTENRLCSDSFESIIAHIYSRGAVDCLFTLYKNGLLRNVSA